MTTTDSDRSTPTARSFLFTRDPSLGAEAAEDYAGRKVPHHWKRPVSSLAITLVGSATSVFSFALGGQIVLESGMPTLLVAVLVGFAVAVPLTVVVMWRTAGGSFDTDLLSRGVGYGYRGSALPALVYGLNWLMYAGFETAYLGAAVHAAWTSAPLWLLYAAAALVVVPLNWFGMSQMHWLQKWSLPLFVLGLGYVVYQAAGNPAVVVTGAHVGLDTVLPALGAVLGNVGIWILLIADFSRFVRSRDRRRAAVVASTAGLGMQFLVLPLLGGWLALHIGSANPGSSAVELAGVAGLLWVTVTQLRVQEGNYYLGSLALSTVVSRLAGRWPRRPVFLVLTAAVAFVLALVGLADHLTAVLTFMGVFLFAWVGTIVGSVLAESRRLARGDTWIEHRRPYLRSWGVPAITGLVVASVVGGTLALSGRPASDGGFLGIVVAAVLAPGVTLLGSRGRPVSRIHGHVSAPEHRDHESVEDREHDTPQNQVTCARTGARVMAVDACEWPPGSGRVVSARAADLE